MKESIENGKRAHAVATLIGVFAIALAVRLIGISWGLPTREHWYSYHPDEAQMLAAIASIDFFSGDLNPGFFNYPSLYIYLSAFSHLIASGLGLTHLPSNDPAQSALFTRDILLSARVVTTLLGAATAPLVYLIVRQIGGYRIGVLASLLMAALPGHLQHSHFATVDVPATFFVMLCLWLAVRALRENAERNWRIKQLLWSGFVAGLAAATKYNAGLVLVAPLIAWLFLRKKGELPFSGAVKLVSLCILGFLVGCPFALLDFPTFWGDGKNMGVAYELFVHPRQGHGDVFRETGNGWIYHATFNAPFLLTWPLLIASAVGIARTRLARRPETCMLFAWCALYFFALGFSQVRFLRYLLPIAPALCVFAACGIAALRRYHAVAARVVGVLLLLVTAWGARDVLYPLAMPDPRDRAALWMEANTQAAASVGMPGAPWFYSPPLSPLDAPPYRALSSAQLSQLSDGRYEFIFTGFDAETLLRSLPEYFVMSELEWREPARLNDQEFGKFLDALEQKYLRAETFKNRAPLALPGRGFVPHDFLYPNPEIRIYRRR